MLGELAEQPAAQGSITFTSAALALMATHIIRTFTAFTLLAQSIAVAPKLKKVK